MLVVVVRCPDVVFLFVTLGVKPRCFCLNLSGINLESWQLRGKIDRAIELEIYSAFTYNGYLLCVA